MKDFKFSTTFFVVVTLLVAVATLVFSFFTFKVVSREATPAVTQTVTATPTAATESATPVVSVSPTTKSFVPFKAVTKPVVTVAPSK